MISAPEVLQQQLRPHPSSAGQARRLVGRYLADMGRDDLVEPAELLTSEVVTNALMHAGSPIALRLVPVEAGVRVEVDDGSPHLPRRRDYTLTASTGRGITMLEQAADAWGVLPNLRGKTVWFQLSSHEREAVQAEQADRAVEDEDHPAAPDPGADTSMAQIHRLPRTRAADEADCTTVELLGTPLLLHAVWYRQAEVMLRDYLMASIDLDSHDDPLRIHSDATDATEILAGHIPSPDIGSDPGQVMSTAAEPLATRSRVLVPVAPESVPHFDVLDHALESAIEMAESGTLLSPAVQPELRALGRWLCHEVHGQSDGAAPTPWTADMDQPPPVSPLPLVWDAEPVDESSEAVVAADDTNRIVAVSDAAIRLLGAEHRGQLLGRRLVTLLPRRYRQAHIAGFAMHVLTGRSPLIDTPAQVPVRRCDGDEVTVELDVDVRRLPYGRTVFVVALRYPPA